MHQHHWCAGYSALATDAILTLMCLVQDQPSHSPQPHASLISEPDKPNATLSCPKRCYSPDWLLSHQHQRQQEESPSAPQDLHNRIGEDLWAPNWQSAPSQSSSSRTPSSSPNGGRVATSPDIAHCNKGKGVLFYHEHLPSSSASFPADAGPSYQEATVSYRHNLKEMVLAEPLRFVDRHGMATPFFMTVSFL